MNQDKAFRSYVAAIATIFCTLPLNVQAQSLTVPVSINPELAAHTKLFEKKIYQVAGNIYSAVGYGLANIIMIEGTDGIIIVDTGCGIEQAAAVLKDFRKITDKPIKAIIYTHHHADHVNGTTAFVSIDDVKSGKVPIIAQDSLVSEYQQENGAIVDVMSVRAGSQYNSYLQLMKPDETTSMNSGIGPIFDFEKSGFIPPTKTFKDALDTTIAGVPMQLRYVPSEASSEICIYLPTNKVLLSAEVIQDHTFPNLYTLRGANFRNPKVWVASIDLMRQFDINYMVPQHGPPVMNKAEAEQVMMFYRDAIQYVHNQTIRYINKGLSKDEIMHLVKLPPELANYSPWLREFYGTVEQSVPAVYTGYIGWFDGDPVALNSTPQVEYARRLVDLMGGHDKVLAAARQSYDKGDNQFAAELSTYLVHIDNEDMDARNLKAAAFKKLGYATINANWRGLYLTAANVLEKSIDLEKIMPMERMAISSPEATQVTPMLSQLEFMAVRLKAEETVGKHIVVIYHLTDSDEYYTSELRHGILDYGKGQSSNSDITIEGTKLAIGKLISGIQPIAETLPAVTLTKGSDTDLKTFLGYFEVRLAKAPNIFIR